VNVTTEVKLNNSTFIDRGHCVFFTFLKTVTIICDSGPRSLQLDRPTYTPATGSQS